MFAIDMSIFKEITEHVRLTTFSTLECSQAQDLNNDTISGQIGPQVPSGSILEDFGNFTELFVYFAVLRFTLALNYFISNLPLKFFV